MSNDQMLEDSVLIDKILQGDMRAFQLLVKQYEKLVWHIVSRVLNDHADIEDVSQEIFIKVYHKLEDFTFNSKLSTWIATIAYREAINHWKKNKRKQSEYALDEELLVSELSTPESLATERDLQNFLNEVIKKLPEHYRSVLTLYHLKEFNYKEIEEITGMPEGTVKNYLFRARKILKEILSKQYLKEELIY